MAIRRHIFHSFREGKRQFATWILFPEKHIRNSITRCIAKVPRMYDCRYRSDPRHGYGRALLRNNLSEIYLYGKAISHTALVTTTVLGFTAATFAMSSSVRPGRAKVVRSCPSVSQSAFKPTTAITASASLARSTAC